MRIQVRGSPNEKEKERRGRRSLVAWIEQEYMRIVECSECMWLASSLL